MRRVVRGSLAVACACGAWSALPAAAAADSVLSRPSSAVLDFRNVDAGVANELTVGLETQGRVRFHDTRDQSGINSTESVCTPGAVNQGGFVVEWFCPPDGFARIEIDLGPDEDSLVYSLTGHPGTLRGGAGLDSITAGSTDDLLDGGQGNDVLDPGAGSDTVVGGPGDDRIAVRDGVADTVDCGPGADDAVVADAVDTLTDCEQVQLPSAAQPEPTPGPGGGPDPGPAPAPTPAPGPSTGGPGPGVAAADSTPPRLTSLTANRPRITRKTRRIPIRVQVGEAGQVDLSGFLAVGGMNLQLPTRMVVVPKPGVVTLNVPLTRAQVRKILADLRRRRRPGLSLTLSAADSAGNTSRPLRLLVRPRR